MCKLEVFGVSKWSGFEKKKISLIKTRSDMDILKTVQKILMIRSPGSLGPERPLDLDEVI